MTCARDGPSVACAHTERGAPATLMNDLARIALRAARRRTCPSSGATRRLRSGVAGFVAPAVTDGHAGGRIGPPQSGHPAHHVARPAAAQRSRQQQRPGRIDDRRHRPVLLVLWLVAIRIHHAGRVSERTVWLICAAWTLPVRGRAAIAQQRRVHLRGAGAAAAGRTGSVLGRAVCVRQRARGRRSRSVWRSVPSPYGPLATTLQHLAVAISGGNPLGAALVFRAIGVLSLVGSAYFAAEIAGPRRRVQASDDHVLNPLVLLHVVSAAHLDGAMCVLLLGAVVAANQRNWALGIVLAVAAGADQSTRIHRSRRHHRCACAEPSRRRAWQIAGRDVVIAAAGRLRQRDRQERLGMDPRAEHAGLGHTALAPASLLSDMLNPVVKAASFDDLAAGGRITALIAAGCIASYSRYRATRALNRTVGYGMLAIGVLSPVVYPVVPARRHRLPWRRRPGKRGATGSCCSALSAAC